MKKEVLYGKFAKYYDLIYKEKKYDLETKFINSIVKKNKVGNKLLDVACGTGSHDKVLVKNGYDVFGVDLNDGMLKVAKKKVPGAKYKQGDMKNFSLGKKFDIVMCLFTSLNYNLTKNDLLKTIKNFKRHMKNDGIMILDCPSFNPTKDMLRPFAFKIKGGKAIVLYEFNTDKNQKLDIIIYWQIPKGKKYEAVKDYHSLQGYTLSEYKNLVKKAGLKYKVYWDFSTRKKKGDRPLLVCTV